MVKNKIFFEGLVSPLQGVALEANVSKNGKIPYTNVPNQYTEANTFSADCAQITITNDGTSNMFLNGILFPPGVGISFSGNSNEEDETIYKIRFDGAGNNLCTIWRKIYA